MISSRPSATNANDLAPMGFRFYSVMPLHDDVVTTALGGASPMAEYVETHLELSLAKDAREKREAPATREASSVLKIRTFHKQNNRTVHRRKSVHNTS